MNIQCGKKKKKGNRFKCCASGAGCRQGNSPAHFSFVIFIAQNSSALLSALFLFVLMCRPRRGMVGIRIHVQSPLARAGTERTGFHILRMKTGKGGEGRKNVWITSNETWRRD